METGCGNIIIYISVRQHDGWCELSISGNGPGIKGVYLDKVFDPGVSTKTDHNRRGFGLSSVVHAVDRGAANMGLRIYQVRDAASGLPFPCWN
jgi:sensor histidine kinase regulating citrate/malate metabolism